MEQVNPETPKELVKALAEDERAAEIFQRLPPSHRREYVVWIESAKQERTRTNRARKAVERLRSSML